MKIQIFRIIIFTLIFQISNNIFSQNSDTLFDYLNKLSVTEKIQALNTLAINQLFKLPEKTIYYSKMSIEFAEKVDEDTILIRPLINLSKGYYYLSKYDSAIYNINLAFQIIEKLLKSEPENRKYNLYLAEINNNIGTIYYKLANYSEALKYYFLAEKLFLQLDENLGRAKALNNIAIIYRKLENYDKAIENYNEALEIYSLYNDTLNMGVTYNNISIAYKLNKDTINFYIYAYKSLEYALISKNNKMVGTIYFTLGNYFMDINNLDSSIYYLNKSVGIKKLMKEKIGIALVMSSFIELYLKSNEKNIAQAYIDTAFEITSSIDNKDIAMDLYNFQCKIDSINGNYFEALKNYQKYTFLKDSIYKGENIQEINDMQTAFDIEKKDVEIKLQKLEIEKNEQKIAKQNSIIIAFILIIITIVVFSVFIFKQNKKIKYTNTILNIKNTEINQQKEEITTQANNLYEANIEINIQKDKIEEKNIQINHSIIYASRIQNALIPNSEILFNLFPESFILFKPRNIVSGDFYYIKQIENKLFIVAADCTGHGAPGAFMSMLGITLLNEIVRNKEITNSALILDELREQIKNSLQQSGQTGEQQDGMDIAFCAINTDTLEMSFAGAHNPLYLYRNVELTTLNDEHNVQSSKFNVIEADRQPVGIYIKEKPFTENIIQLQKDDLLYIFTDGFSDQFGGKLNEKFKIHRFKILLSEICNLPLIEQFQILESKFNEWKENNEQTDDVLVMGIKI